MPKNDKYLTIIKAFVKVDISQHTIDLLLSKITE